MASRPQVRSRLRVFGTCVRLLASARGLANESLRCRPAQLLPPLTPYGLRRSLASLLYPIGETPPVVVAEMAFPSGSRTLRVRQTMRRTRSERASLRAGLVSRPTLPRAMITHEAALERVL